MKTCLFSKKSGVKVWSLFICIGLLVVGTIQSIASSTSGLGKPEPTGVYGGRILWMNAVAVSSTETLLYISTQSANSLFYTTITHSGGAVSVAKFSVVPDTDASAGYGSGINRFAADGRSGYVYVVTSDNKLVSCNTSSGSLKTLVSGIRVDSVYIIDRYLFFTSDKDFHFGTISSGRFSESRYSPVSFTSTSPAEAKILVNPANNYVYIFVPGTPPSIYVSSDTYNSISSSTTFSSVSVSGLGTSQEYSAFGIGPDGRIFVGGVKGVEPSHTKYIAYTDDGGSTWTAFDTGVSGTAGYNIAVSGTSSAYYVFFGTGVSTDKGTSGSWTQMPNGGTAETHPNDGAVCVDPNNSNIIYLTTDQGIGASENLGKDIYEIDDGVEAVQINDFDMNAAKTVGWAASKSGVRHITNYGTASEKWSVSFPNNDGSPYYSVAMDPNDSTGDTAYAGNTRLYKTTDGGSTWTQLFTTESISSFDFWSYISAIAVCPNDPDIVVIGIRSPSSSVVGGLYYTTNATAASPTFTALSTSSYVVEVNDLLWTQPASATSSSDIYVACEYEDSAYGVKTLTYNPSTKTFSFNGDMISAATGTLITDFSAKRLAKFNGTGASGDIYVAGNIGTSGEPRVYVMQAGTTAWQYLAYATLPTSGTVTAATVSNPSATGGVESPHIAIGENIYAYDSASKRWSVVYTYPVGTEINVLYWDDLLVGTGTGLYEQPSADAVSIGSLVEIVASNLGKDADGNSFADSKFTKKPKVWAVYTDPKTKKTKRASLQVITKVTKDGVEKVQCIWKKKISMFCKRSFLKSGLKMEDYLAAHPENPVTCELKVCVQDSTGNKGPFSAGYVVLVPPSITEITDESGNKITSAKPGDVVIIKGKFFGTKNISVWLEYEKMENKMKALRCKVLKDGMVYNDSKGKSCPMDYQTGDSQLKIQLPSKLPSGWDHNVQHDIVIDNRIGVAVTDFSTME